VEQQPLLHVQRSVTAERRGSPEETKRILQEIERINHSLGYKKKNSYAFPRVANNEGYFYPRQQFRPEFLTKTKPVTRYASHRSINPFSNQNYFYPTPYLHVPTLKQQEFYPFMYAPMDFGPVEYQKISEEVNDGSIRLGTIIVLPSEVERNSKSINEAQENEKQPLKKKPNKKPSSLEEIANIAVRNDKDEKDQERQESEVSTVSIPMMKNDKYLNIAKMNATPDNRPSSLLPFNVNRAFNFTTSIEKIQNFTQRFTTKVNEKSAEAGEQNNNDNLVETTSLSPEDLLDEFEEKIEDKEDEKSPFGLLAFGPKQQLQTFKEGGLIIQRLRVRQGGIAIAGPGGVATVINRP
jgi:hypothetical protein